MAKPILLQMGMLGFELERDVLCVRISKGDAQRLATSFEPTFSDTVDVGSLESAEDVRLLGQFLVALADRMRSTKGPHT